VELLDGQVTGGVVSVMGITTLTVLTASSAVQIKPREIVNRELTAPFPMVGEGPETGIVPTAMLIVLPREWNVLNAESQSL